MIRAGGQRAECQAAADGAGTELLNDRTIAHLSIAVSAPTVRGSCARESTGMAAAGRDERKTLGAYDCCRCRVTRADVPRLTIRVGAPTVRRSVVRQPTRVRCSGDQLDEMETSDYRSGN